MSALRIGSELVLDEACIVNHIIDYYSALFWASPILTDYSDVRRLIPPLVSEQDNRALLRVPLELEIKDTIFHWIHTMPMAHMVLLAYSLNRVSAFVSVDVCDAICHNFWMDAFPPVLIPILWR